SCGQIQVDRRTAPWILPRRYEDAFERMRAYLNADGVPGFLCWPDICLLHPDSSDRLERSRLLGSSDVSHPAALRRLCVVLSWLVSRGDGAKSSAYEASQLLDPNVCA